MACYSLNMKYFSGSFVSRWLVCIRKLLNVWARRYVWQRWVFEDGPLRYSLAVLCLFSLIPTTKAQHHGQSLPRYHVHDGLPHHHERLSLSVSPKKSIFPTVTSVRYLVTAVIRERNNTTNTGPQNLSVLISRVKLSHTNQPKINIEERYIVSIYLS